MMTKTQAIHRSAVYVSIAGHKTSWTVYSPYKCAEPNGPSMESHAASYGQAVHHRTAARACVALAFMGRLDEASRSEVEHLMYGMPGPHGIRSVVTAASAKFGSAE